MNTLKTLSKTAKLAWQEALFGKMFQVCCMLLAHTVISTLLLLVEKDLVDRLYHLHQQRISLIVLYILAFFLLRNLLNVVWTVRYLFRVTFDPKFAVVLRVRLIEKLNKLNLIYFEDAELFDRIEKAKRAWFYAVTSFSNAYQTVFGHFATVLGATIYLTSLKPIFVLIVVFAALPRLFQFWLKGRKRLELEDDQARMRRKGDYYYQCMTDRRYYKETRLFGAYSYFKGLWQSALKTLHRMEWRYICKLYPLELLNQGVNFGSYIATLMLAVWYLYRGEISIGGFVTVLSALRLLDTKIGDVLRNVGKVLEEGAVARNYFSFLQLDEKRSGKQSIRVHPVESIQFAHVSFTYPSLQQDVIKDLSLTIHSGETIAVVGLNGAGKTTFVKLLLGLLQPTTGTVMYNGVDLTELDERCLYEGSSALFQTFGMYRMSVGENVAISDAKRMEQAAEIKGALGFAGFNLDSERFPLGVETQLGREFGGTDLSGGQWQLLALARAYFRESDLIILDEPTSAIDPLLENEIFESFHSICKDKTAVIVTHRLGVTKMADRILVFENGRVVEDGAHEALISAGGTYARLFFGQSDWYERDDEVGKAGPMNEENSANA